MAISENPFRSRVKLDAEAMTITIEIVKKEDDSVIETGVFNGVEVHENLRKNVALYGLSKLLQDRASEVPVGPGKIQAMKELMEQFKAGTWTAERKSTGVVVSPEVEAIAQLKGRTIPEIQASLKTYTQEQKDKIFANAKVKELADQIRAARGAAEAVDLADLA